jgi:hypothetical protein
MATEWIKQMALVQSKDYQVMNHTARCLFLLFFIYTNAGAQVFRPCKCDSIALAPQAYQKCKIDAVYEESIIEHVNYLTFLKTEVLSAHRNERANLQLPRSLQKNVRALRALYDSILDVKIAVWSRGMDRNQQYVQPKAYVVSLLSMYHFKIYPDVYAVLLNPVHLALRPKTDSTKAKEIQLLVEKIHGSISPNLGNVLANHSGAIVKMRGVTRSL